MIVDIMSPWHVSSNETWNWTNPKIAFNTHPNIFYILNHLHYTSFTMRQNVHKWHSGNYNCRNNLKADIFTLFYYSQLP